MLKIFDFPQHVIAFMDQQDYNTIYASVLVLRSYNKNPEGTFSKEEAEEKKATINEILKDIYITTGLDNKQFTLVNHGVSNYNSLKPIWPTIMWKDNPYEVNHIVSYYSPSYYNNNLEDFRRYPNGYLQHGQFIPCEDFSLVIKELEKISLYYVVLKKKTYVETPYYIKDILNEPKEHRKNDTFNGIRMILLNMGELI